MLFVSAGDFLVSSNVVVLRDGRWFCTIEDCPRVDVAFETSRSAKSHPWAAHAIRSRNLESIKRRQRRYKKAREDGPPGEPEELSPPPPLHAQRNSAPPAQWKRGALELDEIETVRRRMLYHVHTLAQEEAAEPKRVLDLMRAMLFKAEMPEGYIGPAGRRHTGLQTSVNCGGLLPKTLTRERWLAELVRAVLVREIRGLARETQRSRGAVIDAVREVIKDRLYRKRDILARLDEDKSERLMTLLRPSVKRSMAAHLIEASSHKGRTAQA